MINIKCGKCKKKLIRYEKIGKGRILYCYNKRIAKIFNLCLDNNEVKCKCGNLIGHQEEKAIKMRKGSFTYSGTKTRK